eukprot:scaffold350361_cov34-Prasinocladus_malaysianus.AAC.1
MSHRLPEHPVQFFASPARPAASAPVPAPFAFHPGLSSESWQPPPTRPPGPSGSRSLGQQPPSARKKPSNGAK